MVGALALAMGVPATAPAAPAGDEYLPAVPKANGKKSTGKGSKSSNSAVAAPASRGGGGPPSGSGGKGSSKDREKGKKVAGAAPTVPLDQTSSDDSGGALDTLLDPVVLLLIAGVAVTAVGMTMRRRQAVAGDIDPEGTTRELGSAPPTPDGEIVGREPPG